MSETAVRPQGISEHVRRHERGIRLLLTALIIAGALLIARRLPLVAEIQAHHHWIDELGFFGPLAFGVAYAAAVVLLIPAAPLTVAAGALFGVFTGTAVASLASTTGAALALLIARTVGRRRLAARFAQDPRHAAIDKAVSVNGWKIVALLRLSPVVPFNLLNYFLGLTGIRFATCVFVSWAAMLPGTVVYVSLGEGFRTALQTAEDERERTGWESLLLFLGVLATIAVALYVAYLAKRAVWESTGREAADLPPLDLDEPVVHRPWRTAMLALLAAVMLAGAAVAQFHPELFRRRLPIPAPPREIVPVNKDVTAPPRRPALPVPAPHREPVPIDKQVPPPAPGRPPRGS
jgi:uncharacterized membrane protein YdjX (TVP38/TMEM64 family)